MENWWETGFNQAKQAREKVENRKDRVNRFYLKPKTSKEIIFVDDIGFAIQEHQVWNKSGYVNFYTCPRKAWPCALCEAGVITRGNTCFTVVDLTGWRGRDGMEHGKNELALFLASNEAAVKLGKEKDNLQSKTLIGCRFRVFRPGQKYAYSFEFIKQYKPEDILAKVKPFNYQEVLKPLSEDELRGEVELIDTEKTRISRDVVPPVVVSDMLPSDDDNIPF